MPSSLPRPTRRTTLTQFCNELVPAWSAQLSDPALGHTPELCIQLDVDGDIHHLVMQPSGTRPLPGPASAPHVTAMCNKAAFRTAMERLVPLAVDNLDAHSTSAKSNIAAFTPHAAALLEKFMQNPGTLVFVYIDDAGDPAQYALQIGTGVGPKTQVQLDDKKLDALIAGHAGVPQVLASVALSGDAAYLTRLVQLLLHP